MLKTYCSTEDKAYTDRLLRQERVGVRRFIYTQIPYRWNIRRLNPGFTFDIGCGLGRNLMHLKGNGVGIDHNLETVTAARKRGLAVFTPQEFKISEFNHPQTFDSILLSHVAEHMKQVDVVALLKEYLHLLKLEGKLIIITPQEIRFDPTHVELMDFVKLRGIVKELGLKVIKEYSFPFPRCLGRIFRYNEFISVSRFNTPIISFHRKSLETI